MEARLTKGEAHSPEESTHEGAMRPEHFGDFPGQTLIKDKLKIYVQSAIERKATLDHVLLSGPPGLGKTTLSHILAHEMGVSFKSTSGPALRRKGDLAALLTGLKPNAILFIDEIHRLTRDVEEYLYSAMEDFFIDLITGEGLGAQSMRFQLVPFTLVGATTQAGLLKKPFRDRFGIQERLDFYEPSELIVILKRSSLILGLNLNEEAILELAKRSRGTPRVANRLLRRIRDFAQVARAKEVSKELVAESLAKLGVDQIGLEKLDRRLLENIAYKFSGGPVGIETLAASMSEERMTLEEVYEPFLLQKGLLEKTPRGRKITQLGIEHLNA